MKRTLLGSSLWARRGPDILEVRPDKRGEQYGRLLAEWAIERCINDDLCVIQIGCAPETSVPFWEKMGFTVVFGRENAAGIYAYRILPRTFEISSDLAIKFEISFYAPSRGWDASVQPFKTYSGEGGHLNRGCVQLPERAICFDPSIDTYFDCVIRIAVGGETVFEDKLKRDRAIEFGVKRDQGYVFFLDTIIISEA
jgi:hypothetical protein